LQYNAAPLTAVTGAAAHRPGRVDMPLLFLTVLLLAMGVIMVLSASFASAYYDLQGETGGNAAWYFIRQLIFALAGVAVMLFCSRLPTALYYRVSPYVMASAVAALALVLVLGVEVNGAKRWISLGFTTFQPSEIVKVALILFYSRLICHYGDRMRFFRWGIAPFAALLLLVVGLLVLEPHFSASIIVIAIAAVMLFVGGVRLGWFIGAGAVLLVGAVVAVSFVPYVAARVEAFRDPFSDLSGKGWQIVQSLYAIGSGGFLGLGLGQSRQKFLYLPEEHNDFIFAVVCEELGFLGAGLILCLFALLIIRGYTIAIHASDRYGFLLGVGISSMLALQTFLNVAVCTNLIPCTGISLPLFSYGGTALLIQLAEIGILLSVSREMPGNR